MVDPHCSLVSKQGNHIMIIHSLHNGTIIHYHTACIAHGIRTIGYAFKPNPTCYSNYLLASVNAQMLHMQL